MPRSDRRQESGQVLVLFALSLTALILGTAVVVDGGFAFAQRRSTQNAADFAAMAGARILGMNKIGQPAGTAANVRGAITETLAANNATLASAQYVDTAGVAIRDVFPSGSIPSQAFGIVVEARSEWRPFLLGVVGVIDWAASARATARTTGASLGGAMLPLGIRDTVYNNLEGCPQDDLVSCLDQNLTGGHLEIPGGFGWLSFGIHGNGGKCDWDISLGMKADGGCQQNQVFLQSQIWPEPDSHGCCSEVGNPPGSVDLVSTLTGNEWGDLTHYIGPPSIPVWIPIWDRVENQGANAYYHIVGYGAIIFAASGDGNNEHARWLKGARVETNCTKLLDDGTLKDYSAPWNGTGENPNKYCTAPLGEYTFDATGEVFLVR